MPPAASKTSIAQILQQARSQQAASQHAASQPASGQSASGPAAGHATASHATASQAASPAPRQRPAHRPPARPQARASRRPVRVRPGGYEQLSLAAELGTAAPIGPAVIELLSLAYRADVPALLVGTHGLGKSEITAAAAEALGIDCISRDLSLMEPPDLVGLPRIDDGSTTFLPPDFLPRETGRGGFLLIEEINRAPRYMQACCLELLTSRRLNSYRLPAGWLPVACINPKAEGYHVDLLDAALLSRFMRIEVCAAVGPWATWARASGIHPTIVEYVESVPHALDEAQGGSNPRSWTYASRALQAAGPEMLERSPDTIVTALTGLVGPVHTTALLRLVSGTELAITPADVLTNWPASRATMRRWVREGRLDLLATSMRTVLQWVRPEGVAEQLRRDVRQRGAVKSFIRLLPGDLAEQARACLLELGYTFLLPATPATDQRA